MTENTVLQARDVGLLVGLTEDAVKQWTIGRPYKIRPSIRSSTGRGIPNLYSFSDAVRFAITKRLTSDGFQSDVVELAQTFFEDVGAHAKTLRISSEGRGGPNVELSIDSFREIAKRETESRQVVRSFYLLDVASLREELEERLTEYMRKDLLVGAPAPKKRGEKP